MTWKRDTADTPVAESLQIRGNQVFPVRLSGHENKKHSFVNILCWSPNFPFLFEKDEKLLLINRAGNQSSFCCWESWKLWGRKQF